MTDVREKDTHEKLANDIYAWCATFPTWNHAEVFKNHVMEWLDREAALTERECLASRLESDELAGMIEATIKKLYELQSQLDNSMPLPLDADGEPIHIGDILHSDEIGIDFECQGLSIDMRGNGRREHWTVCYQVTDGISDWTAAKRCHHANPETYSDILESFVHAYNLFMYASASVSEFKSKEELFAHYIHKLEEVGQ